MELSILTKKTKSKKAQAWGFDLMIAIIIFSIGIVAFYLYILNNPREAEETIDALFYDGGVIAESILSKGYPTNWHDFSDVVTIGILTDNKIDETKLQQFHDLTTNDYERTKLLFHTKYDYYFNLSVVMDISGGVEGIGKNPETANPENLVKITRFTIYQNKPVTAYVFIFNK